MSKRYPGGIIRKTPQTPSQTSAQGIWDMASVTQAVKENTWPIAGVPDPISKSLRFRASASAYLNRTPSTAGNQQIWTWSGWVKRGTLATLGTLFSGGTTSGDTTNFNIAFTANDTIALSSNLTSWRVTSAVYRDPAAWYHLVIAVDTTQATADNRIKLYVNGLQVTAFGTNTAITQNSNTGVNSTEAQNLGRRASGSDRYTDSYLTEVYLIDGQALTPSSFGGTNDQTGVWQPIAYTGTYGTNGFYLPFSNTASTATLGYDFSGNSNNWTTNNISLTSGTTYDSMVDVPTQWIPYNTAGDTGALFRGNYCTLNPLDTNSNLALSNGNLTAIPSSTADYWLSRATMQLPSTGKWYWELTLNNTPYLYQAGIYSANRPNSGEISGTGNEYQVAWGTARTYIMYQSNNAAFAAWGTNTNPTSGDVLMFAVDSDNGTMWVGRNGTWYNTSGTANPATNTDPRFSSIPSGLFAGVNLPNPASGGVSMNFGQRPFSYTPPTGFKTLCTTNLSTPTIGATASTTANKYFDATTYTGNGTVLGSTQTITNAGSFQPDLVWLKSRSNAQQHNLYDVVRGISSGGSPTLFTDATTQETTYSGYGVSALNSNGFTVIGNGGLSNNNGFTYVGWQWKANGAGVTNTAGSITSTVSANTTAGFSIATLTAQSSGTGTFGHGLGVAPSMVILKQTASAGNWVVYHTSIGNGSYLVLNTTAASVAAASYWNSTSPSSTVVTLGTAWATAGALVAYCFAQVAGYSAFGSYTGNSSSDGPFVFTGFRPRYLLIKSAVVAGGSWVVFDSARSTYNVTGEKLAPNTSDSENSGATGIAGGVDFLSNGFKIRLSWGDINTSNTLIYAAFAEFPFKFSLAR